MTNRFPQSQIDKLRGDFWPDGDNVDDFITAVRQWRNGDAGQADDEQGVSSEGRASERERGSVASLRVPRRDTE